MEQLTVGEQSEAQKGPLLLLISSDRFGHVQPEFAKTSTEDSNL